MRLSYINGERIPSFTADVLAGIGAGMIISPAGPLAGTILSVTWGAASRIVYVITKLVMKMNGTEGKTFDQLSIKQRLVELAIIISSMTISTHFGILACSTLGISLTLKEVGLVWVTSTAMIFLVEKLKEAVAEKIKSVEAWFFSQKKPLQPV